jgi:60 kDa SS-A/Ro ribonucleoprotein
MTIRNSFKFTGGGTNVKDVFIKANRPYENIIICSDMQSWIGHKTPSKEFNDYKIKFNCNPYVYSWDVAGYGTMMFPESRVFALSGFSDKVFDIISNLKEDKQSLINQIKSTEI